MKVKNISNAVIMYKGEEFGPKAEFEVTEDIAKILKGAIEEVKTTTKSEEPEETEEKPAVKRTASKR